MKFVGSICAVLVEIVLVVVLITGKGALTFWISVVKYSVKLFVSNGIISFWTLLIWVLVTDNGIFVFEICVSLYEKSLVSNGGKLAKIWSIFTLPIDCVLTAGVLSSIYSIKPFSSKGGKSFKW